MEEKLCFTSLTVEDTPEVTPDTTFETTPPEEAPGEPGEVAAGDDVLLPPTLARQDASISKQATKAIGNIYFFKTQTS
ncbi:hypothetical protein SAMN05192585_11370 [Acetanaerobacterium elongatum]|uniref:Uncharacterized protein n=1 Tax=Acetanaerobacterium elongatum TaxID=258515 RepID=A0A1G9ZIM0_9FIRM|nr:hypothetical protein SAMN05192585_11370 [Acetanaerobacterium elongatum]